MKQDKFSLAKQGLFVSFYRNLPQGKRRWKILSGARQRLARSSDLSL